MGRFRDWVGRHFGPGPSLYELDQEIQLMRQEWTDLQDWLNRWSAKISKRSQRDTKAALARMAPDPDEEPPAAEDDEIPTDHKADLRRRAFQLRQRG